MPAESVESYASRVVAAFERAKPIGEAIAKNRAELDRLVREASKQPGFYEWVDNLPKVTGSVFDYSLVRIPPREQVERAFAMSSASQAWKDSLSETDLAHWHSACEKVRERMSSVGEGGHIPVSEIGFTPDEERVYRSRPVVKVEGILAP